MVKIMENPMNKWMIWGTPIFGNTEMLLDAYHSQYVSSIYKSRETCDCFCIQYTWLCRHVTYLCTVYRYFIQLHPEYSMKTTYKDYTSTSELHPKYLSFEVSLQPSAGEFEGVRIAMTPVTSLFISLPLHIKVRLQCGPHPILWGHHPLSSKMWVVEPLHGETTKDMMLPATTIPIVTWKQPRKRIQQSAKEVVHQTLGCYMMITVMFINQQINQLANQPLPQSIQNILKPHIVFHNIRIHPPTTTGVPGIQTLEVHHIVSIWAPFPAAEIDKTSADNSTTPVERGFLPKDFFWGKKKMEIPMTDPWNVWYIYLHEWLIFCGKCR